MSDLDDFLKFKSRNDVFQCSYCGEFSEIDVKHEYKIMQDQLTTANKRIEVYKEIIERFCDNVNYYERELAGSWMEIRTDAEQALAKSEQIGETE